MSNGSGNPKSSLDIRIGKEIDAAIGDLIRGLLKKPFEAVGDLAADGIGILGDRVQQKRKLNAQLGLEEVRRQLDANGVEMKDITPPKEEDIHLLISGISLSGDEGVRRMWAGLFAKALEPNSNITAERPFISVLESLSPFDAKVIDLLAFIERTDAELKSKSKQFKPDNWVKITPEEQEKLREANKTNIDLQKEAVSVVLQKAESYGLMEEFETGFVDNLMRLSIVERAPIQQFSHLSAIDLQFRDERDMRRVIVDLVRNLREAENFSQRQASPPKRIITQDPRSLQLVLEVKLTAFGQRFASACGLF